MSRYNIAVLGLLSERPMHGYQIVSEVKHRSMDKWARINTASIYNTLSSLLDSKNLKSHTESGYSAPSRKVYSITGKGKKELKKSLKNALLKKKPQDDMIFKLSIGFISNLEIKEAEEVLKKRTGILSQWLVEIEKIRKIHELKIPYNWLSIITTTKKQIEIELETVKTILNELDSIYEFKKIKA